MNNPNGNKSAGVDATAVGKGSPSIRCGSNSGALWVFIAIYAYQLFNAFLLVKGGVLFFIDIIFFFVFPITLLAQLSRVVPIFRMMIIDGLRRCTFTNFFASASCGVLYGYLFLYLNSLFSAPLADNEEFLPYVLIHGGLAGVFYLALSAGVVEEVLYKTLLGQVVAGRMSDISFAVVSGILFGAAHLEHGIVSALAVAILYGIPTAYYYRRTNNLLGLIVLHFIDDNLFFGSIWAWNYY